MVSPPAAHSDGAVPPPNRNDAIDRARASSVYRHRPSAANPSGSFRLSHNHRRAMPCHRPNLPRFKNRPTHHHGLLYLRPRHCSTGQTNMHFTRPPTWTKLFQIGPGLSRLYENYRFQTIPGGAAAITPFPARATVHRIPRTLDRTFGGIVRVVRSQAEPGRLTVPLRPIDMLCRPLRYSPFPARNAAASADTISMAAASFCFVSSSSATFSLAAISWSLNLPSDSEMAA